MSRRHLTLAAGCGALLLIACSPETTATTDVAPPTVQDTPAPSTTTANAEAPKPTAVMSVGEFGGCNMGGPNCRTRVLWSDGTVTIHRLPLAGSTPLSAMGPLTADATLQIDAAVVTELLEAIEGAAWPGIISNLPPGTCWACVDGIDFVVTLATSSGDVVLRSSTTAFDPEVPEIAALHEAASAMGRGIIFEFRGLLES